MTSIEQMRLKNREVSILFMQQEHANTLKDLHKEIEKLQKRCSELQFQLAMEATYTPQEDDFRGKCSTLESQVSSQKKEIGSKDELLQKKDNRIQNLEQQIRAIEKKYKDELIQKQAEIGRLKNDLEDKSDQIAKLQMAPLTARTLQVAGSQSVDVQLSSHINAKHLVDQYLDQTVTRKSYPRVSTEAVASRRSNESPRILSRESSASSRADSEESSTTRHMPAPPPSIRSVAPGAAASKSSAMRMRRRMITTQTQPLDTAKQRPPSARKLETSSPTVETEEILRIAREQRSTFDVEFNQGPVIPPIKPRSPPAVQGTSVAYQKKSRAAKLKATPVEVETLAVDQVLKKDLRKAHEYNSYGTDA